ncbi:DUF2490 domain-containing protein [Gramella sp. GC03-9]|uniref:DUF2490 domain-containing protein n=1 Tax=Christiangramia oceanisediminis TaxID=2920386 RepID=A0A9X2I838_9FLAO|nr:DUF2490 domain-containing protein [Gramella oceanisediminis]MCP9199539.1 DUF2490 domain-containing protein [Gramella oceanisediminis]
MTTSFFRTGLLVLFMTLGFQAQSQNFSSFLEPDVSLNLDRPNRWSFNFGIANRNLIHSEGETLFDARFLELSHFTSYEVGFYGKLSLGVRYRFNELLEDNSADEIRLTEQYSRSRKYNALKVAQRFRFEQRFRATTSYRTRYQFTLELPLSGERLDQNEFFLVGNTEALLSFGSDRKPGLEQRIGLSLGRELAKGTKLDMGTEYRLANYNQITRHELFFYTGLNISL